MEKIELGLLVMVVGMVRVFVIVVIVMWLREVVIWIVNKVGGEEGGKKKVGGRGGCRDGGGMDGIKGGVDILRGGKGEVIKVEKVE